MKSGRDSVLIVFGMSSILFPLMLYGWRISHGEYMDAISGAVYWALGFALGWFGATLGAKTA